MPVSSDDLQRQPLLRQLSPDALSLIASQMRSRRYQPGQLIALEGDPSAEVSFVAQGLLRQRHLSEEGRQHVMGYLGPGAVLGLIPALDGGPHLASVDALTEATLYVIPNERLIEQMAAQADLARQISLHMAREARRLGEMVKGLALYNVRTRLARFLLNHAEVSPPQRRWTQDMIAAHIGTVRDVVGRVLRDLTDEGIVRRERGRIVVVDRVALEREANDL